MPQPDVKLIREQLSRDADNWNNWQRSVDLYPLDNPDFEVADKWKDEQTGQVFTRKSFDAHRRNEAYRLGFSWFAYGLFACAFVAYDRCVKSGTPFYRSFGRACVINIVVAIGVFLATRYFA
jgi:hypothetical protein